MTSEPDIFGRSPILRTTEHRRGFLGWVGRAGLVTVAALAGSTATGGPASAHAISGGWSDNHTICRSNCAVTRGNIVAMWQSLLRTTRVSGTGGDCNAWVDGIFGPKTESATKLWQAARGLLVDGIVGPQSWGRMRSELSHHVTQAGYRFYRYPAPGRPNNGVTWLRQNTTSSVWQWQAPSGCSGGGVTWRGTGH